MRASCQDTASTQPTDSQPAVGEEPLTYVTYYQGARTREGHPDLQDAAELERCIYERSYGLPTKQRNRFLAQSIRI